MKNKIAAILLIIQGGLFDELLGKGSVKVLKRGIECIFVIDRSIKFTLSLCLRPNVIPTRWWRVVLA